MINEILDSEATSEAALEGNLDASTLDENFLLCLLTGNPMKATEKELNLQAHIRMLSEEYGFNLDDMERDYSISGETEDGKKWNRKSEFVIFAEEKPHIQDNIIRLCIINDSKTKENNTKKGVQALEDALSATANCEFGLWSNGSKITFLQKKMSALGYYEFDELADFPGAGETLDDLDRSDKATLRNPANDSLIRTFKRCHDYIYVNEGHHKTAFWQLLNLTLPSYF